MLARVADSLYWTARAIERADTYARLLEVSHAMSRESADTQAGDRSVWEPLVDITGDLEAFRRTHVHVNETSAVWFLSFADENPNSIISCITRARNNAQSVRDLLPTEVWEALNTVYLELSSWPPGRLGRGGVYPFSRQVRRAVHLLHGLVDGSMRRDATWHFLRLGRFAERADKVARLLEVKYRLVLPEEAALVPGTEFHQWRSLLRSGGADEAYVKLATGKDSPRELVQLLVVDDKFPRSIVFCLDQIAESLRHLVWAGDIAEAHNALSLVAQTRAELSRDVPSINGSLATAMDHVQLRCNQIHAALAESCFAYAPGYEGGAWHAQAAGQPQN